ncbi:dna-directed rna polymerases and iii subunit rpabc5 [Vairimorpha apis BRL 01]|uniref:DNA-directed RNA polymerases I, II, and III subunit RPABC5 n=1 Tax=Vairimorpha apis BRL 01 TaxID=1037528 RepID=T0L1W0_9MICR|nr:dna-directed rna polymerases and iii subunit rpabc5 [Vairimorpha apis BRL 01]
MIIPIRCFTCGKEISSKWEAYCYLVNTNKSKEESLNELDIKRIYKLIKYEVSRTVNFKNE